MYGWGSYGRSSILRSPTRFMYFIPQLLAEKSIKHGISEVSDGNMSYTYGEENEVKKNRKNFFKNLSIPIERVVFMDVQHGIKIINATTSLAGTGFNSGNTAIKADALITLESNLALALLTADCIPVIIRSEKMPIIALAHVSRHNSRMAFLQILVSNIKREFGIEPQTLNVYFAPSIKKDSYILPQFPKGYDLVGESASQLVLKGVKRENIFIDPIDTAINPEFFSHYRDVRNKTGEGRFITTIMLT